MDVMVDTDAEFFNRGGQGYEGIPGLAPPNVRVPKLISRLSKRWRGAQFGLTALQGLDYPALRHPADRLPAWHNRQQVVHDFHP